MILRCFLFLSLFWLFIASSLAQSQTDLFFSKGMKLYNNGQIQEAKKVFYQLTKTNPDIGLYWFNLAACYFEAKDYKRSAIAYSQVVSLKGELAPAANVFRALALNETGRPDLAIQSINKVNIDSLPNNLKEEARRSRDLAEQMLLNHSREQYLSQDYKEAYKALVKYKKSGGSFGDDVQKYEEILRDKLKMSNNYATSDLRDEEKQRERVVRDPEKLSSWVGFIDARLGQDSNVYAENELDDPAEAKTAYINFFLGKEFDLSNTSMFVPSYEFLFDNAFNIDFAKVTRHRFSGPYVKYEPDYSLKLNPFIQKSNIEGEPYLTEAGIDAQYIKYINNFELRGFGLFSTEAGEGEFNYLDGSYSLFEGGVGYSFSKLFLEAYLTYGKDDVGVLELDQGNLPISHTKSGLGLYAFYSFSNRNKVSLSYLKLEKKFDGGEREDEFSTLGATYYHHLSLEWSFKAGLSKTSNTSNFGESSVENKNYEITKLFLGFKWDFL